MHSLRHSWRCINGLHFIKLLQAVAIGSIRKSPQPTVKVRQVSNSGGKL
jgi:hypothetical protein